MFKPLCLSFICLSLAVACQTAPPSDLIPSQPYPQVIPTPYGSSGSYSSYTDKTNADVQERKSTFTLNHTRMSPDQTRVLYTYDEQRKVFFKDYTSAYQNKASGLWLYDRAQQKHTALFPAPQGYNDSRFKTVSWLNNAEIVYLNNDRNQVLTLNVENQESKRLFDEASIISFKVQAGYVFVLSYKDKKATITRINGSTGERRVKVIPYSDFYNSSSQTFDVLTPDLILLGQFKDFYKNNDYPFKVSTTSPPPLQDSFLFDLSTDQFTPIEKGLDLTAVDKIEMSTDQQHFATTREANTQVYDRSGQLLLEKKGSFYWLAANQLLLQDEREISRVTLHNNQAQVGDSFSTQTPCANAQGTQPIVMECFIDKSYDEQNLSRTFRLYPTQELKAAEASADDPTIEAINRHLAPAEKDQPIRIWEEVFSEKGFARLSILNASGELQSVFELPFPEKPTFTFDPNDFYWYQKY
jgi:hypothetical protein